MARYLGICNVLIYLRAMVAGYRLGLFLTETQHIKSWTQQDGATRYYARTDTKILCVGEMRMC
jgi:hypothetical protein